MNEKYEELRAKAFSALQKLSKQNADYDEMRMILGAADTQASLKQRVIRKSIDTEWISRVEQALPALDIIIRQPTVAIEDVEEIVPVELTRVVSEKSVKHLAQHTNLIREIKGDEITPSKILNVYREETYLTYENKFINTLLARLSAFVDRRYRLLVGGSGVEQDYAFDYDAGFEHFTAEQKRTGAKVKLQIALTSPDLGELSDTDIDLNNQFAAALERIERINQAINAYLSSPFAQKLGRNYIRPPVIRTNAILKNKNFKDCLSLWEFIEGYDKAGFSIFGEEYAEKPADHYVTDLYSTMALQYTQFYQGVVEQDVDILAKRQLSETDPDFSRDFDEDLLDDYLVYDSEYKKMVPVSRLMDNRKKLSDDERAIREAIEVALRADAILTAELLRAEEEARRLERERIAAEQERLARLAAMELAASRAPVIVYYKYSFLARYIQSEQELQEHYTAIKNALLSYADVTSGTSWERETFKLAKRSIARMRVKGKTLYLYLAMDPEKEIGTYTSVATGKYSDTALQIKIKSARACKYALAMIALMMEQLGAQQGEAQSEDYAMPYETTDELVERGLVKMIVPDGIVLNEFDVIVKKDMSEVFSALKQTGAQIPEQVIAEASDLAEDLEPEEQISAPEEIPEPVDSEQAPANIETAEPEPYVPDSRGVSVLTVSDNDSNFRGTYIMRYLQAGRDLHADHNTIKNTLLAYSGIGARVSSECETFMRNGEVIARINVKGKNLYLYLALGQGAYSKSNYVSSVKGKYTDTSLLIKVKSEGSCKLALSMIQTMMQRLNAQPAARTPRDYSKLYTGKEELMNFDEIS